jgi:hypothetical protein
MIIFRQIPAAGRDSRFPFKLQKSGADVAKRIESNMADDDARPHAPRQVLRRPAHYDTTHDFHNRSRLLPVRGARSGVF